MTNRQRRPPITLARIWVRNNIITTVLIIFIIMSLLIHALTIGALFRVRQIVTSQLEISAQELSQVRQQEVRYNFPVDQTFTIDTTVTISETVTVPLSITVPIKQTIKLPIDTPVGPLEFDVPLDFTVPVSDTVEVPINKSIPFQADIPVQTDIPINLELNEPPIGEILRRLEDALRELRNQL